MRRFVLPLILVLVVAAVAAPLEYFSLTKKEASTQRSPFFFGLTYGGDTVEGGKLLIDRVQNYTNVFVVNSYPISTNKTALDEICNYAAQKGLSFFVYFFSLYSAQWQQNWVVTANQAWGEKFLGVYLRDEPGGRQIDLHETVSPDNLTSTAYETANYSEAAQLFVSNAGAWSMSFLKNNSVPVVVSDYALYWFDYEAGFKVIFAELGSNNSVALQIAQCRGAAASQGKEWGSIITWTYDAPPYIEDATKMYHDLMTSYDTGANYCLVFNYPETNQTAPYGILTDAHFLKMQSFWTYTQTHSRATSDSHGQAALVLPKDYGWGLRHGYDSVWGLWDSTNPNLPYSLMQIGHDIFVLQEMYGSDFDVVYDRNGVNPADIYSNVYYWNTTAFGTPPPPITPSNA